MEVSEFDTDALLKLLSDALRRGPGSPEWHDALLRVGQTDPPVSDEYRLLLTARERIESGKSYRQVRAGPAFTRAVFEKIDEPNTPRPAIRPSVVISLICLLGILIGGGVLLKSLLEARPAHEDNQLAQQLFITPKHQWNLWQSIPAELIQSGSLPLSPRDGGVRAAPEAATYPATGIITSSDPINLDAGACVEADMRYQPGPTTLELVLTERPPTDTTNSTTTSPAGSQPREFTILCDETGVHCTPASDAGVTRPLLGGPHTVRLKCLGNRASADIDGRIIWSGLRPIGPEAYVELRWTRPVKSENDAGIRALRVLLP